MPVNETTRNKKLRLTINWILDFLMFVVPILELSEVVTFISPQYLPYYMITTVILRRLIRVLEDYLDRDVS